MNRQRRLDAIARRRALIDSQIQMLSNTESRIPNIIRSRTGRTHVSSPRPANTQFTECFQNRPNTVYSTQLFQNNSNALVEDPSVSQQPFKIEQNRQGEGMYMAVLNDNDQGGQEAIQHAENTVNSHTGTNEGVPIIISEDFAKILTGGTDQLSHPLQTIEAPDGTVMVVLEGNHFNEGDTEFSAATPSVNEQENQGMFLSSNMASTHDESTTEDAETESEESYIIVQTADGDVLVPSSKLCSQLRTQMIPSGESIVQFIATESGAIEQLISSNSHSSDKNSPSTSRRSNQNGTKQNKSLRVPAPTGSSNTIKKPVNIRNLNNVNKLTPSSTGTFSSSQVLGKKCNTSQSRNNSSLSTEIDTNTVHANVCEQEKPRPFRFELPELENDLEDCFMSVPVPIKIDSLVSQTETNKCEDPVTSAQTSLADFSVPTTNDALLTDVEKDVDINGIDTDEKFMDKHLHYTDGELVSDESQVIAKQDGEMEESPDLDLLSQDHTNGSFSDSAVQCIQCFEIFYDEPSFLNHAPQCQPCLQNHTVNGIEEVPLLSNFDEQAHVDSCKNFELNDSLDNCILNNNDDNMEGNLIIKSVNSLSDPNAGTHVSMTEEPNFSSPTESDEHAVSTVYIETDPTQQASTSLVFRSNDFISKIESTEQFCVQLDDDSEIADPSPSKKAKLSQNTFTESCVEPVEGTKVELVGKSYVLNGLGLAQPIKCDTATDTAYETTFVESFDVGRRTLSKVSAKANIPIDTEVGELWDTSNFEIALDQPDRNGNTVSLQSARIRSRNDRIKAMDTNGTSEEELGCNFRNIFEQVVKQSITFQ